MSAAKSPPTVVDLFCGVGGFSLGFARAGFDIVHAYDSWAAAVQSYRTNFSHPITQTDILDSLRIPDATVIVGGPPCQGFSSAGCDARGTAELARFDIRTAYR